MATSKRLAAHRETVRAGGQPAPSEDEDLTPDKPGEDDGALPTTTSTNKERSMDDEAKAAIEAARTEGHDAALKTANDRMKAVFASEHYPGREAAANKLLGKPNLSAEDITELLADMPKAGASTGALTEEQQREAAEEAGRREMQQQLQQNANSDIDAGGGAPKPDPRKAADDVWAKQYGA